MRIDKNKYVHQAHHDGKKHPIKNYNFFGFTIFDIFHIVFGITLIIMYTVQKRSASKEEINDLNQAISYEGIQLIFAILLFTFVDGIADISKKKELIGIQGLSTLYLFAWVVVAGAMLTPELIVLPEKLDSSMTVCNVFYFLELSCLSLAIFTFAITVFFSKEKIIWEILMLIGIFFIALSVPFGIAQYYLPFEGHVSILETISNLAALTPVAFCLISLKDVNKAIKEEKQAEENYF